VLTYSRAQKCRLDGLFEADGRASSTRAVADLWCLGNAGGGADSRFISASQQSVERGSTVGRCGRVVATRSAGIFKPLIITTLGGEYGQLWQDDWYGVIQKRMISQWF